jgi:hypothetical protein
MLQAFTRDAFESRPKKAYSLGGRGFRVCVATSVFVRARLNRLRKKDRRDAPFLCQDELKRAPTLHARLKAVPRRKEELPHRLFSP